MVGTSVARVSEWTLSAPFKRCMQCLLDSKKVQPLSSKAFSGGAANGATHVV
jgi:hypothetical protein